MSPLGKAGWWVDRTSLYYFCNILWLYTWFKNQSLKMADIKKYTLYVPFTLNSRTGRAYLWWKGSETGFPLVVGKWELMGKRWEKISGVTEISCTLIGVWATWLYAFVKTHQTYKIWAFHCIVINYASIPQLNQLENKRPNLLLPIQAKHSRDAFQKYYFLFNHQISNKITCKNLRAISMGIFAPVL